MRLRWTSPLILAILTLLIGSPIGIASAQDASMEITLNQTQISTSVGRVLTLESHIVNRRTTSSGPVLAHVNVASADGSYVDLEDWSADVTQQVDPLEPGADTTLTWDLQAVNAGSFHVYVVLLPQAGPLVASGSTRVEVGQKRSLNAGGALPVAIAVPLLLGLCAAALRYRVRRRTA
jgi:hypothetical protein